MILFVEIRFFLHEHQKPNTSTGKKSWVFPTLGWDSVPKDPDWLDAGRDSPAGPPSVATLPYDHAQKSSWSHGCVHAAKRAVHHQQALSDKIHALCPPARGLWKRSDWAKAQWQTNLGSHIKQ